MNFSYFLKQIYAESGSIFQNNPNKSHGVENNSIPSLDHNLFISLHSSLIFVCSQTTWNIFSNDKLPKAQDVLVTGGSG